MLQIRRATIQDTEQLLIHGLRVSKESNFTLPTPDEMSRMTIEQEEQWIESSNHEGILLVAEVDGQIIGLLNFVRGRRKRIRHHGIFGIGIQKAYWNQGVGTKLLNSLLEWAKDQDGLEIIYLGVLANNPWAIHVSKKLCFREIGLRSRHVKLENGEYIDEILMEYVISKNISNGWQDHLN